jgi:hypothetical protein
MNNFEFQEGEDFTIPHRELNDLEETVSTHLVNHYDPHHSGDPASSRSSKQCNLEEGDNTLLSNQSPFLT